MFQTLPGPPKATKRIGVVVFDDFNIIDATGPIEVFDTASQALAERFPEAPRAYETRTIGLTDEPTRASCGVRIVPDQAYRNCRTEFDTLLVSGGNVRRIMRDAHFLAWLSKRSNRLERTASVCTGAFVLAEAGLLDERRATTHWRFVDLMQHRYPSISVEPDSLFVESGGVYTSAGVTAGMDLALALVEQDFGHELALSVARDMVLFLKRPGGQSQFSSHLAAQTTSDDRIGRLTEWVVENLGTDLSVEVLAHKAAMSPRNFARVFVERTGMTPAKFVEKARVDYARRCLEETDAGVAEVATRAGFGSAERMRRTFQRHLGVVPQDYKRRFEQHAQKEPSR